MYDCFKECLSLPPNFSHRGVPPRSPMNKDYYFLFIRIGVSSKGRPTTACMTSSRGDWVCLQLFSIGGIPHEVPWARIYQFLFIRIGVSSKRRLTTVCMTCSRGVGACHHLFFNKGTIQWVPRKGIRTLSRCARLYLVILLRTLGASQLGNWSFSESVLRIAA